jgi:teichoic acid transport system permease protein
MLRTAVAVVVFALEMSRNRNSRRSRALAGAARREFGEDVENGPGTTERAATEESRNDNGNGAPLRDSAQDNRHRSRMSDEPTDSASKRLPTVYASTASGLPLLRTYFVELAARRRFVWHLARTDLKAEHFDSAIGQLWVILDPMLLAAVYFLLRTVVKPIGTAANRNAIIAHLLWAVFVFTFVSNTMMVGSRSLLNGRQLILNASFPRMVLPLAALVKGVFNLIPTLAVYLALHALLGRPLGWSLLFLPPIIALLIVMTLGLALFFAPLMVFYRDTGGFLPYATRIWLYVTPVLYLVSEIAPRLLAYLRWNPLYPFYAALEQVFAARPPSPAYLVAAGAWAVGLLLLGAICFLARERDFAVRL